MRPVLPIVVLLASGFNGHLPAVHAQAVRPQRPIRLVVAIALDQFRPDYLVRWKDEFSGGFARLLREGVFFTHAEQDHAMTETAPGHSTMMSGRSPRSTGIVENDLGVPDPQAPLIGATATGASPRRFLGTTLLDWMLARDPSTRALSVSRKDRGAILPIGRAKVPVFWYAEGKFTTSKYYGDTLPGWLVAWNARDPIGKLRGTSWTLSHDRAFYPEVDDRPFEAGGSDRVFPHVLPDDWTRASTGIVNFSIMDSLTLDVAIAGVKALALGQHDGTDFLSISLSTTDAVGHRWGPGSREMHDHVLNVDRWLGAFFDSLGTMVPEDRIIISVTSDHGGTEYPEAGKGGRVGFAPLLRALNDMARQRWRIDLGAVETNGLVHGDFTALAERGVNVDSMANAMAAEVRKLPGVRRVYTPKTLARAKGSDIDAMRWQRSLPPGFSWLIATSLEENYVFGTSRAFTGHGTTNPDDVRVPILFRIPGVPASRVNRVVRTIDIAPTLAAVLGIRPTQKVEGVPLSEITSHLPKP